MSLFKLLLLILLLLFTYFSIKLINVRQNEGTYDDNLKNWCSQDGNYSFGLAYLTMQEKSDLCKGIYEAGLFELEYESRTVQLEDLRIITGFSKNHVKEASIHCNTIMDHPELKPLFEDKKVKYLVYLLVDLKENDTALDDYKKKCPYAEFREFDFSNFPNFVKNLKDFRWKPLVIADALKENDLVLYADASVMFTESNQTNFKELVNSLNDPNPDKYPFDFICLSTAGHSIHAATKPETFRYMPLDMKLQKSTTMCQAGLNIWKKSSRSLNLLQKWSSCGLIKECMTPKGSIVYPCNRHKLHKTNEYAGCHRNDQSALNIVLAQLSNGNDKKYYMLSPLFKIERIENKGRG